MIFKIENQINLLSYSQSTSNLLKFRFRYLVGGKPSNNVTKKIDRHTDKKIITSYFDMSIYVVEIRKQSVIKVNYVRPSESNLEKETLIMKSQSINEIDLFNLTHCLVLLQFIC
jgi:hypothetical protein